jgi:hypothetical protein
VTTVEVVTVGKASTWVIFRESQIVEILFDRDDRRERVEVGEGREVGFDEGTEDSEGVVRVEMEVAVQFREDRRSYVRVVVARVRSVIDDEGIRSRGFRRVGSAW